MTRSSRQRRSGFTLTELAIVLGVIGAILGGIWTAASMVRQNLNINKMQQELEIIVSNVRTLYSTRGSFPGSTLVDITAAMMNANVFPSDMIVSGAAYPVDPYGFNVAVYQASNAPDASNMHFEVFFTNTKNSVCSAFLSRVVGNGSDPSLLQVFNGSAWEAVTTTMDATTFSTCTGQSFEYKL